MKICPVICTQCNGQIPISSLDKVVTCPFCGTSFIVEYSEPTSQKEVFSTNSIDSKQIDIKIQKVNNPIVNFFIENDSYMDTINEQLIVLSTLSFYQKKEYLFSCKSMFIFYSYESELTSIPSNIEAKQNEIKQSLSNLGFSVFETLEKDAKSPESTSLQETYRYTITGLYNIKPLSQNRFLNSSIDTITQRMLINNTLREVSKNICLDMDKAKTFFVQKTSETDCKMTIIVHEDKIMYTTPTSIYYSEVSYNSIGFNNLQSFDQILAMFISLWTIISNSSNESNWSISRLAVIKKNDSETCKKMGIQAEIVLGYEKKYQDW